MNLSAQARDLGILTEFFDGQGQRHVTDEAALRIIVDAFPNRTPHRSVEGSVVVRTGRGTKLDAATRNTVVAFEVDELDPREGTGWSVLVTGVAHELTAPEEVAVADASPPARWAPGPEGRYIAISVDMISGRRIKKR